MELLSSTKNMKVLSWRSLRDKKGRLEQNAFLVEGVRMVREALSSSFTVNAVLLREGFVPDFDIPESIRTYLLPEHVFQSVCDTKSPQGIAAVLNLQTKEASGSRLLALDGVQDPGNDQVPVCWPWMASRIPAMWAPSSVLRMPRVLTECFSVPNVLIFFLPRYSVLPWAVSSASIKKGRFFRPVFPAGWGSFL